MGIILTTNKVKNSKYHLSLSLSFPLMSAVAATVLCEGSVSSSPF